MKKILLFVAIACLIYACSTTSRSKAEKNIRNFISQFEQSLQQSDEIILQQFKVDKEPEAILKAINIMQNKKLSADSVLCTVNFNGADVFFEDNGDAKVSVSALLKSLHPKVAEEETVEFTFSVKYDGEQYYISKFDATEFYHAYQSITFQIEYKRYAKQRLLSRKEYFERAKLIQAQFDSVIWYTRIRDSSYYYVVKGTWIDYLKDERIAKPNYTMGLVNQDGRIIVPPAYDLVGTIDFETENVIEVVKDNKVGHYSLSGKELVPAQYDWIIPYPEDSVYAIVKSNNSYGWIDSTYTYREGFPSVIAKDYIQSFSFLKKPIEIKPGNYNMIERLEEKEIGYGMVIPPKHYDFFKAFDYRIRKFLIDFPEFDGEPYGTEYINKNESVWTNLTEHLSIIATNIQSYYLGGREGFYEKKIYRFVDREGHSLAIEEEYRSLKSARLLDRTTIELNFTSSISELYDEDYYYYSDIQDPAIDWNSPAFKYLALDTVSHTIKALKSNREHDLTAFVKLDSSYLIGKFYYWNPTTKDTASRNFVSHNTIRDFRNDILAVYGFDFPDPKVKKEYEYKSWYKARYDNYEDFWDEMTEIDKHNLLFLESLLPETKDKTKPST